ncbi:MAG TPA: hypothetical protein HPP77_05135 [Candidatus Hydrogenedentes bacterium]|nr:hypothetical protein [Candidatus Hydrogenedentota bacterium]HIJ74465.1 hypothetical protein [Candidatus Hydrogenedentota bacterium]
MAWHAIEGEEGCAYAVANNCVAVIVDALRASATVAALLDAGATEIIVVREVVDAFAARALYPDALLFGERGGLHPEGFDYGNSPRTVAAAAGRRVVFTTTTGAGLLVAAWGSAAVCMGSVVNVAALVDYLSRHDRDVVLIPAGLAGDPGFDAQEDWAAAAAIAVQAQAEIEVGADRIGHWRKRIEAEGIEALFASAPHAEKLRRVGLGDDISFCARVDIFETVPVAVARNEFGLIVQNGSSTPCRGSCGSRQS